MTEYTYEIEPGIVLVQDEPFTPGQVAAWQEALRLANEARHGS